MKNFNTTKIIGIDHGYGNMKTANFCFPTGIMAYDSEPLFTADMLSFSGKYYLIGEGHKEFAPDKIKDEDYYILTLAAVAKELKAENITKADIHIAAGLPLTWTSGQKADFAAYLAKNKEVNFTYKKEEYHICIVGVSIYPQGYAAIAPFATKLTGVNLIADIGNGTMNVLYMINGKPQSGKMFTEKFGTYQCTLAVREAFMQKTHREINDYIIEEVLRTGTADICAADLKIIKAVASEYVRDIFRRLREHGYDESTMKLYVTGGGGCLIKNFYKPMPTIPTRPLQENILTMICMRHFLTPKTIIRPTAKCMWAVLTAPSKTPMPKWLPCSGGSGFVARWSAITEYKVSVKARSHRSRRLKSAKQPPERCGAIGIRCL